MTAPVLQFKRGLLANLPGLRAGEPGFTTDSYDLYVGLTSETSTNKFFGSHRYWTKETTSTGSGLNLVEGTSNGSDFITLKSPDSLAGITTYTLPATPTDGYFLKTNSTGTLSWEEVVSTFDIAADTGTTDTVSTGATITFAGGEGIDTVVSDDTITIAAEIASASNAGIASFSASYFTVSGGGDVTIVDAAADGTTKGIAAFDTDDFDASSGVISLGDSANGAVLAINGTTDEVEVSRTNGTVTVGLPDNVIVGGALTATTELTVGTGVGVTQFSSAVGSGTSTSSVPTSSAVIDYVGTQIGNVDLTLGIDADTGGPSTVTTSQTLTIAGTTNEVNTSVSGQTITVGLPDSVTITTALTTPTVNVTNVKANDGTTAITITNATGAVSTGSDLTVGGNLYVNGSTTQVNTSSLTVEDRTIELGIVDGSAPSSTTTWDLGVLFNYFQTSAKKSAVVWEQADARFKFGSEVSDGGGTDANSPQITFTAFAPIEIGALWVNDCAGQSQVISCTGTERFLENITVDAGTF